MRRRFIESGRRFRSLRGRWNEKLGSTHEEMISIPISMFFLLALRLQVNLLALKKFNAFGKLSPSIEHRLPHLPRHLSPMKWQQLFERSFGQWIPLPTSSSILFWLP